MESLPNQATPRPGKNGGGTSAATGKDAARRDAAAPDRAVEGTSHNATAARRSDGAEGLAAASPGLSEWMTSSSPTARVRR